MNRLPPPRLPGQSRQEPGHPGDGERRMRPRPFHPAESEIRPSQHGHRKSRGQLQMKLADLRALAGSGGLNVQRLERSHGRRSAFLHEEAPIVEPSAALRRPAPKNATRASHCPGDHHRRPPELDPAGRREQSVPGALPSSRSAPRTKFRPGADPPGRTGRKTGGSSVKPGRNHATTS